MVRKLWKSRTVLACTAVSALALGASSALAAGSGVTFTNDTGGTVWVLARYGSDARCNKKPESTKLSIEAGQTASLDSGDGQVCWCRARSADDDKCRNGWIQSAAGSKQRLQ